MKKIAIIMALCAIGWLQADAIDEYTVQNCQRQAEYYQKLAEEAMKDAEFYLQSAKRNEADAADFVRSNRYDTARDYYSRAADDMLHFAEKCGDARALAEKANEYLVRAQQALR